MRNVYENWLGRRWAEHVLSHRKRARASLDWIPTSGMRPVVHRGVRGRAFSAGSKRERARSMSSAKTRKLLFWPSMVMERSMNVLGGNPRSASRFDAGSPLYLLAAHACVARGMKPAHAECVVRRRTWAWAGVCVRMGAHVLRQQKLPRVRVFWGGPVWALPWAPAALAHRAHAERADLDRAPIA